MRLAATMAPIRPSSARYATTAIEWSGANRSSTSRVKRPKRLGVTLDLHRDVETLPVAGKQLVAIGRALMSSPRLLIMDEPTAALTGREIETLLQVVREIRGGGVTVVFISHKTREVLEISDRVTVLRNGAVVASGEVTDFDEASITRAVTGLEHREEPFRYAPRGRPTSPRGSWALAARTSA